MTTNLCRFLLVWEKYSPNSCILKCSDSLSFLSLSIPNYEIQQNLRGKIDPISPKFAKKICPKSSEIYKKLPLFARKLPKIIQNCPFWIWLERYGCAAQVRLFQSFRTSKFTCPVRPNMWIARISEINKWNEHFATLSHRQEILKNKLQLGSGVTVI